MITREELKSIEDNLIRKGLTASKLESILATVETHKEEIHPTHNKPKRRKKKWEYKKKK